MVPRIGIGSTTAGRAAGRQAEDEAEVEAVAEAASEAVEVPADIEAGEEPVASEDAPVLEPVPSDDSAPVAEDIAVPETDAPISVETEPVEVTPSIGEAPAEIDEIVTVPPQDGADETRKDDKPGEVPPVVPEPKG